MTLFPDAQRKGQEEIDRAVGSDRLPDFEDRENLPYIEAMFKECLRYVVVYSLHLAIVSAGLIEIFRWHQPLPLGVPHLLTEDDTYNGYFLPAGTTVAANQW